MIPVVVTGYSLSTSIGESPEEFESSLFAGRSGVISIRGSLAPAGFPVPFAAPLKRNPRMQPAEFRRYREMQLRKLAHGLLSGLPPGASLDGMICSGSNPIYASDAFEAFGPQGRGFEAFPLEDPAMIIADEAGKVGVSVRGEQVMSISTACSSGNTAIGIAFHKIRSGQWKRALVAVHDFRTDGEILLGYAAIGALNVEDVPASQASCPFSKNRRGFVKGEGVAMLLLEAAEEAVRRSAVPLGRILGFGTTTDAWQLTGGRPDNRGVVRAMELALKDAGIRDTEIDYVNAHGTSTQQNDYLETQAIKTLLGPRAYQVPISSLKSQIGHTTRACGGIEAVACLMMLQKQRIAPTINYLEPDPDCDLDYVPNKARDFPLNMILSNNLGFGGVNSCLVLGRV